MRLKEFLNEDSSNLNILGFLYINNNCNEVSNEFLSKLQLLGRRMGIKITKSKTLSDLYKDASDPLREMFNDVILYSMYADVMDPQARKDLIQSIKRHFKRTNREDIISFMLNLDRMFFGITAIPRHMLQNILGVKFTSYDNWVDSRAYILRELDKIKNVLQKVGAKEEIDMVDKLYKNVEIHVPAVM